MATAPTAGISQLRTLDEFTVEKTDIGPDFDSSKSPHSMNILLSQYLYWKSGYIVVFLPWESKAQDEHPEDHTSFIVFSWTVSISARSASDFT